MIKKRFDNCFKFNSENKDLILAALSIPNIRGDFIADDDDFIFAKQLMIAECRKFKTVERNNAPETNNMEQNDGFILRFNSRRINRSNSIENEIDAEVAAYLMDSDTDYKMLNRYPAIRSIFFKYNTTLSSSAAVERVFSQSLMIFTPRRNRISAQHFEQVLLLKHNNKLMTKK